MRPILLLFLALRLSFAATITLTGPGATGSITGFGTNDITIDAEVNQQCICAVGTQSSAVVSATGITLGPPRSGVLAVFSELGESESPISVASEQIGPLSCLAQGENGTCDFPGGPPTPIYFSFPLGVPFTIQFSASGATTPDFDAGAVADLEFQLYEQAVPGELIPGAEVAVFDQSAAPEPASTALLGAGLSCLLVVVRRRRLQ